MQINKNYGITKMGWVGIVTMIHTDLPLTDVLFEQFKTHPFTIESTDLKIIRNRDNIAHGAKNQPEGL